MAETELTTIARPYARAAFATALDNDRLADWSSMLEVLAAVSCDSTVQSMLENPSLVQDQRAKFLIDICGDQIDDMGKNFLSLLAEYKRISLLPEVYHLYELLKANHEKTVEVEVISAYEFSEKDKNRLTDTLRSKLKRKVNITSRVDSSLIGGLIVRTEDSVIDNTIRGRLAKLAHVMNS
ncbi:MAG: F0F1 ATP synthase subunit delta [Gammaproteobacteria bacterium]|nr:F0F1 ATP synthase subunit delta [Gammaproteobacteria bacterium]